VIVTFKEVRSGVVVYLDFPPHIFSSGAVPSETSPYIANTFLVSSDAAAATKNNDGEDDAALDEE